MATAIAMMVGGAIVNAVAFTGGNFLFSRLGRDNTAQIEKERHDKAIEQLQAAQAAWSKKRTQRLDWINAEMQRERHAVETFQDVDYAMQEYAKIFPQGKSHKAFGTKLEVEPMPQLSDFYTPSDDQQEYETAFIIAGTAGLGLLVYKFL